MKPRRIIKKLISYLPRSVKETLIHRLVRIPDFRNPNLIFKVAQSQSELDSSFRLVYDSYVKLNYTPENDVQMRATLHHALPSTSTLIALYKGEVVGTLTLVRESKLGLPLETLFDLSAHRPKGGRMAEITSLTVHEDFRRSQGGAILFGLLKLFLDYATTRFGCQHLLVAIHPRDRDFYSALLCFTELPGVPEQIYMGDPARVMHLNLTTARAQAFAKAQKVFSKKIYNFFFEQYFENIHLPDRPFYTVNDPVVSYEYYQKVLLNKLGLNKGCKENQQQWLENQFTTQETRRQSPRHEVQAPSYLATQPIGAEKFGVLRDVTRGGFCIESSHNDHPLFLELIVEVGPHKKSTIRGQRIWQGAQGLAGYKITYSDETWSEFLTYLENRRNPLRNHLQPLAKAN